MPHIHATPLICFATELLHVGGLSSEEASLVAESLVASNLRGYESHGVMRIPFYLDMIAKGEIVAGAELTVERESATLLVADANWGIGQTQARALLDRLMAKARQGGVGVGTMLRCGHIGRLGEYCERAAEHELVTMLMVNSHGAIHRVAPPGGKESRLGTNPIACGLPHGDTPVVLDFSTSATAEGKVRVKHIAGEKCPDGWLIDSDGRPTNDPGTLYREPHGCILPMGGPQMYKGFGLSLMVEILTGAMSGGLCSREVPETPKGNCVFMMVLAPEHFGGAEHFARETHGLVEFLRSCPTVDGVERIVLPGDPERTVLAQRTAEGIPFDEENWAALTKLAERLEVPVPG